MQTVKSFGVLSVAKFFGIFYAEIGVLAIPLSWAVWWAGHLTDSGLPPSDASAVFSAMHFLLLIAVGGVTGFITGAVGAVVYNLVSVSTGGIQIELETGAPTNRPTLSV